MMTSAQVVKTSVTVTNKSPFQEYLHADIHSTRSTVTPKFTPFTVMKVLPGAAYLHQIDQLLFLEPFPWVKVFSVSEHLQCFYHPHHMPSHFEVFFYLSPKSILEFDKKCLFHCIQNNCGCGWNFKLDLVSFLQIRLEGT